MRPIVRGFLVVALCGQLAACTRLAPAAAYTEEDVRSFVQPGTSREAILTRFGRPTSRDENPRFENGDTSVDEIFSFVLPPPSSPRNVKWAFGGFVVNLKQGKAVSWQPIHRDIHIGP